MAIRIPRWLAVVLALLFAAGVAAAIPDVRDGVLRSMGRMLVAKDTPVPADIIVISLDADGAGALEAADLVRSGIASRVAVFADPPSGSDHEFIRRGLPYEDVAARLARQLGWLGISAVERIPRTDAGTQGEAEVLPDWARQNHYRSIVVVSSMDHSRRLRRVLARAMEDLPVRIVVWPARHSTYDPDRWWQSRAGVRIFIIETQKLLLDVVLHPW